MSTAWMQIKLANWARWAVSGGHGALGYPRQSTFARQVPSTCRDEASVPLDDLDAAQLDGLITALKYTHPELYLAIWLSYVGDPDVRPRARVPLDVRAMMQRMQCAKATVYTRREAAVAALVDAWPREK